MTEEKLTINCKTCGKQLTTRTQSISIPNICSKCWKEMKEKDINNYQRTQSYGDCLEQLQRDHENWRAFDGGSDF